MTLTVPTQSDTIDESDSVITARVTTGSPYQLGSPSSASVTVRDDDVDLPQVTITPGTSPVPEGTAATFTLSRRGAITESLNVTMDVEESGSMINGTPPTTVRFNAGSAQVTLTVPTQSDTIDESDSVITATVKSAPGATYAIGMPDSATVTVQDDDEWSQSQNVNDELLPRVTQAMLSSTLSAISSRLDMSVSGVDSKGALQLGKEDSLEQILASLPVAADGSSLDLKRMLVGKSILLPLNASGNGLGDTVLWGRGDYRDLRGGNDRPLEWNGDLVNIHLGADMWLLPDLLAGVAVSWSEGDFDYRQRLGFEKGDYVSKLTSVHPYVSWSSPENAVHTWATAGYGWGEVEIDDGSTRHSSDTRLKTGAVGISSRLATAHDLLMPGTSTLRFKGEGNISQIKADGSESINPLTADIQRLRMAFEGKHLSERGEGKLFIPSVEVGLRIDRGEGLTGTGLEIGTGVDYTDTIQGLTLKGQARMLIDHADDYDEWSIQGEVRVDPGPGQLGLSLSLIPSWGALTSTMDRLWSPDANTVSPVRERPMTGRLDAKFDYGLSALGGRGLLTPYAHFLLAGEGGSDFRFGSRLEVGPSFSLGVEGGRLKDGVGSSDHKIGFWSEIQF